MDKKTLDNNIAELKDKLQQAIEKDARMRFAIHGAAVEGQVFEFPISFGPLKYKIYFKGGKPAASQAKGSPNSGNSIANGGRYAKRS